MKISICIDVTIIATITTLSLLKWCIRKSKQKKNTLKASSDRLQMATPPDLGTLAVELQNENDDRKESPESRRRWPPGKGKRLHKQTHTKRNFSRPEARLKKLGYRFDENGMLAKVETAEPFEFIDHEHYEEVAQAASAVVHERMRTHLNMHLVQPRGEFHNARFFVSKNIGNNSKLVVLLINGSGSVMYNYYIIPLPSLKFVCDATGLVFGLEGSF